MSSQNPTEQSAAAQAVAAHTPGPWRIERAKVPVDGEYDHAIYTERDRLIIGEAFGRSGPHSFHHSEANARLMAAAPDLLAACQASIAYDAAIRRRGYMGEVQADGDGREHYATGDDLDALYEDWITKARAAVEKAAGR